MDGLSVDPAKIQPLQNVSGRSGSKEKLEQIAQCHRQCLPRTASSLAGLAVLFDLYRVVNQNDSSVVLVSADSSKILGFISMTLDLRKTESQILKNLSKPSIIKLALFSLLKPRHNFARRAWENVIPKEEVAYILTLGVLPEAREKSVTGTLILTKAEQVASQAGKKSIWVDTEASNINALRFYQKNCYQVVSQKWGQVLMEKKLR